MWFWIFLIRFTRGMEPMKSLDYDGAFECFVGRWIETAQSIRLAFPFRVLYCFQPANFPEAASGFPLMRFEWLPFGIDPLVPGVFTGNLPCVMFSGGVVTGHLMRKEFSLLNTPSPVQLWNTSPNWGIVQVGSLLQLGVIRRLHWKTPPLLTGAQRLLIKSLLKQLDKYYRFQYIQLNRF